MSEKKLREHVKFKKGEFIGDTGAVALNYISDMVKAGVDEQVAARAIRSAFNHLGREIKRLYPPPGPAIEEPPPVRVRRLRRKPLES